MAVHTVYGSSWSGGQIGAAAEAYPTAKATPDPSHICDLLQSLQILNQLSKARYLHRGYVRSYRATIGTPYSFIFPWLLFFFQNYTQSIVIVSYQNQKGSECFLKSFYSQCFCPFYLKLILYHQLLSSHTIFFFFSQLHVRHMEVLGLGSSQAAAAELHCSLRQHQILNPLRGQGWNPQPHRQYVGFLPC